jgi:hypothetical protein
LCFSDDGRELLIRSKPGKVLDMKSNRTRGLRKDEFGLYPKGFTSPFQPKPAPSAARTPVPDEIRKRFDDRIPHDASAVEWTADRKRLIVYHPDGCMAVWDIATGGPVYRCHQFKHGSRWLTVMPDGSCRGNLEYVRYRKKGTNELVRP